MTHQPEPATRPEPRLAVVAVPTAGVSWPDQVRRWEGLGYAALLVPDTVHTVSPFVALAAAAALTERIRLRPWVLAAPLRSPPATAREVLAVQQLSAGRCELGIGTGRPQAGDDAAALGLPWPAGPERLAQLVAVVTTVRERVDPVPPVAVTASGPRAMATAAGLLGPGDRLGLALPPAADDEQLATAVAAVRGRGVRCPLTLQLSGVGDRVPQWLSRSSDTSAAALRDARAVGLLPSDPGHAAELVGSWRERFGVDELAVPAELADDVAEVLSDALAGS